MLADVLTGLLATLAASTSNLVVPQLAPPSIHDGFKGAFGVPVPHSVLARRVMATFATDSTTDPEPVSLVDELTIPRNRRCADDPSDDRPYSWRITNALRASSGVVTTSVFCRKKLMWKILYHQQSPLGLSSPGGYIIVEVSSQENIPLDEQIDVQYTVTFYHNSRNRSLDIHDNFSGNNTPHPFTWTNSVHHLNGLVHARTIATGGYLDPIDDSLGISINIHHALQVPRAGIKRKTEEESKTRVRYIFSWFVRRMGALTDRINAEMKTASHVGGGGIIDMQSPVIVCGVKLRFRLCNMMHPDVPLNSTIARPSSLYDTDALYLFPMLDEPPPLSTTQAIGINASVCAINRIDQSQSLCYRIELHWVASSTGAPLEILHPGGMQSFLRMSELINDDAGFVVNDELELTIYIHGNRMKTYVDARLEAGQLPRNIRDAWDGVRPPTSRDDVNVWKRIRNVLLFLLFALMVRASAPLVRASMAAYNSYSAARAAQALKTQRKAEAARRKREKQRSRPPLAAAVEPVVVVAAKPALAPVVEEEENDDDDTCVICMAGRREVAIICDDGLKCGHICLCIDCATQSVLQVCPICREPILRLQRVRDV